MSDKLVDPLLAEIDWLRRWVFWGVGTMWLVGLGALLAALHLWSPWAIEADPYNAW